MSKADGNLAIALLFLSIANDFRPHWMSGAFAGCSAIWFALAVMEALQQQIRRQS